MASQTVCLSRLLNICLLKYGRTPIITYQRRKHRRLNKRKLIGLPEGTTNDSCQEERVEPQS